MIQYTIHILIFCLLAWIGSKYPSAVFGSKYYWTGLFIRLIGSMSFAAIYMFWIKEGDTLTFFKEASKLADLAINAPDQYLDYVFSSQYGPYKSEARDGFFIKVMSLFVIATDKNFWLINLYLGLLSFLPVWYLIRTIGTKFPKHKWSLIVSFLILPSPIFWTAGVLKDCLVFAAIALIAVSIFKTTYFIQIKWYDWMVSVLGFFILWELKYFLFGLCLAGFSTVLIHRFFISKIERKSVLITTWGILFAICLAGISLINPNLYLSNFPQAIYDNYIAIAQNSSSDNSVYFDLLPSWGSLILNIPKSLFAGLYRPLIGESSLYYLIHELENLGLILLSVASLFYVRKTSKPHLLVYLIMVFILILAALTPLASPNFGSLMRYKAVYLPYFFYLISIVPFSIWFPNDQLKS